MEWLLLCLAAIAAAIAWRCVGLARDKAELRRELNERERENQSLQDRVAALEADKSESRALFSTLSDVAFDIALILDQDGRIITCNQAARRFLGVEKIIGERLADVIDAPELSALVKIALEKDDSPEEQFVIDGSYFRAAARVTTVRDDRRIVGIAMQDITDLVNLNRARRDLVANISHELRTPITRIRLIIEGLFLDADRPKRKASIQSLKEIAMETDALLWLSQELLDLSMIESGQAIMRLVSLPLKPLVDDAIDRLSAQAEVKNLKVVSHVPARYSVLCDADQLRRVIENLLHNAIKWSPKGEAVTITAAEAGDDIQVSVMDNGPGVPEDLRERVFERFYQADVSRSGDDGTGLGLAICKHIIEAHGGTISANGNRHGQGGHFIFSLLRAEDQPEAESIETAEAVSV